ncbi:MAG: hypothetical protein DRP15_01985, partial [Candidatus Aenigmatarchaeota archaeon]
MNKTVKYLAGPALGLAFLSGLLIGRTYEDKITTMYNEMKSKVEDVLNINTFSEDYEGPWVKLVIEDPREARMWNVAEICGRKLGKSTETVRNMIKHYPGNK